MEHIQLTKISEPWWENSNEKIALKIQESVHKQNYCKEMTYLKPFTLLFRRRCLHLKRHSLVTNLCRWYHWKHFQYFYDANVFLLKNSSYWLALFVSKHSIYVVWSGASGYFDKCAQLLEEEEVISPVMSCSQTY